MEKDKEIIKPHVAIITKTKNILFASRKRKIITTVILVLIVFFGWQIFGKSQQSPQYQTATVTKGTLISSV